MLVIGVKHILTDMDDIRDILLKRDFDVPPEVKVLKEYVLRHYNAEVTVTVDQRQLIIAHPSAALIGTLRLNTSKLQRVTNTDKRISFRIG